MKRSSCTGAWRSPRNLKSKPVWRGVPRLCGPHAAVPAALFPTELDRRTLMFHDQPDTLEMQNATQLYATTFLFAPPFICTTWVALTRRRMHVYDG